MNSNIIQTTDEKDFTYEWNDININNTASIQIYASDGDDTNIRIDLDDNFSWRISDVHLLVGLAIIGRTSKDTLPRDVAESVYVKRDALIMDDDDQDTFDYWITGGNTRWRFGDDYVNTLLEDMKYDMGRQWHDQLVTKFVGTKTDEEQEQFCELVSDLIDVNQDDFLQYLAAYGDIDIVQTLNPNDAEYISLADLLDVLQDLKDETNDEYYSYCNTKHNKAMFDAVEQLGWSLEYKIATYTDPNQTTILELVDEVVNE